MNLPKEFTTVTKLSKVLAFIQFITLPIIGFYIGMHYGKSVTFSKSPPAIQQNSMYPTPTVTSSVQRPIISQDITNETDDWIMKKASICNVIIPIPPKKPQYSLVRSDGKVISAWNFREYIHKGSSFNDMQFENTIKISMDWDTDVQDSRTLLFEGDININCSKNTRNYTTQSFTDEVIDKFSKVDISSEGKSRWKVTQQKQQIWQKEVIAISSESSNEINTFYVFVDSENVYLITRYSASNNPNIQNALNQIFNTLQFTASNKF